MINTANQVSFRRICFTLNNYDFGSTISFSSCITNYQRERYSGIDGNFSISVLIHIEELSSEVSDAVTVFFWT